MKNNVNLIYGRRAVAEVCSHRQEDVTEILLAQGIKLTDQFSQLIHNGRFKVREVSRAELDRLTEEGVHQGVAALLNKTLTLSLEELIDFSKSDQGQGVIVVLDHVVDPHNVGSIFRLCEATKVDGIILTTDHSAKITPVVCKASVGATELVRYSYVVNLQRTLKTLKDSGYWIVGAAKNEKSTDLYQMDFPSPLVIVLGAEGTGLRALTIKECDLLLEVPMSGVIDSLNVSQAAAVILYEVLRRRRVNE